jgi:plastocyanin
MKPVWFLCAWLLLIQAAGGGTISGIVRAKGKEGAGDASSGGNYDSKSLKFAQRINYDAMRDFVVYIKGPVAGAPAPTKIQQVRQKDATFIPHVLPVMVGTVVEWPNEDNIFHNVFSKSDANRFDLDLYKKGDPPKRSPPFVTPGEVDVFCSIHARMSCIILVLENPYFAMADTKGRYTITNVPPGHYTLVAWQERLPNDTREIIVPETGDLTGINFTLGIKNLPKY